MGVIYDRYCRDVRGAVQRCLVGSPDIEDIVHAVFLGLPKVAARFQGESCRGWLCGIAARFAQRHRRTIARRLRVNTALGSAPQVSERGYRDPELSLAGSEQWALIEYAIIGLPPKKRAAFVLVEVHGLSTEVTAKLQDVPCATLRTRLFHAKKDQRKALQRDMS